MTELNFDPNPYKPGAGAQPPELAGRLGEIGYLNELLGLTKQHQVNRGMVMSGLRGVGKTVLLNKLKSLAETQHWVCVSMEGQTNRESNKQLRLRFASQIKTALSKFQNLNKWTASFKKILCLVNSFTLEAGPISVGLTPNAASSGSLDIDVQELVLAIAAETKENASGFALFIDEMQDLDPDLLSPLLVTQHFAQQQGLPFYLIGAGLPSLPPALAKLRSYAERLFRYSTIGPLNPDEAAAALINPATRRHRRYDQSAAQLILASSGGYPYFIQELGWATWQEANGDILTLADAQRGVALATANLDAGFYASRWIRATDREQAYLSALAQLHQDSPQSSQVAQLLGQSPTELSSVRSSLIRKGLIFAPTRGRIAFSVPGMAEYINRQPEAPEPWNE